MVSTTPPAAASSPAPGTITTVAGVAGNPGQSGIGGPASAALLTNPEDVAVARNGDVYVANDGACDVLKISAATSIVTIAAGTGVCGDTGNGGPATSAPGCPRARPPSRAMSRDRVGSCAEPSDLSPRLCHHRDTG